MRLILAVFILLFTAGGTVQAQETPMSKADKYFYGYAYGEAVAAYKKDMSKGVVLTNGQWLNMADSYYQLGQYDQALKLYMDVNKNDTIMTGHQFNKMLMSMAKTANWERVKAFMKTKTDDFSPEFVQNADFNMQLLGSGSSEEPAFEVFNILGNSPQSDFSPAFYKGDRLLFSTGRMTKSSKIYDPASESYLDIYEASIGADGNLSATKPFGMLPPSAYHRSTPYYSEVSGNLFYILSNTDDEGHLLYDPQGKNALAIGMVDYEGDFQFLLRDLGTSFYYPFYDDTDQRLYFAAQFSDSYGGTDIYYVNTNNGRIMSQPVNLGPRINSPGNEVSPFILGSDLYFSSDVFYGLGGMDIYKARLRPDDHFSIPVNLGPGINSPDDDFGFIIRPAPAGAGFNGYFSSNRIGGKGKDDIYGYLVEEVPGLKTIVLRGTVTSSLGQLVENATVTLSDPSGTVIKELVTDASGNYQIEIPWRDAIVLRVAKHGYSEYVKSLDKKGLETLQDKTLDLGLESLDNLIVEKEGLPVLKLNNFYFDRGKANITPEIAIELDKVVEAVATFPTLQLRIENHTDSRGSSATNKKISEKRAQAVQAYLLSKGVPASQVVGAIGYGEEHIKNNCTDGVYCMEFLHRQNLRTNIVVANYAELKP